MPASGIRPLSPGECHSDRGTVEGEITSDTEAAGRTVRACQDDPQYKVRSDKTPMADDDKEATWDRFHETVNMSAHEREKWLATEQSQSVGQQRSGDESTGHASGRRIVQILRAKRSDLAADDYAHMRKVVGYAKRHLAQRPHGSIDESAWRYSLMNWGHDPTKP